jgi:4-amino-4-deoxy-L-arabinose transferase-like glycosyltransferase
MIEHLRRITPRQWLVIILILAFIPRAATALWLGDTMEVLDAGGTHDQVSYDMLAYRLATGHGFTFPEPWYPWVPADTETSYYSGTMVLHLAIIYKLFGYHPLVARLFYALLGTAIVYLVYRLGRRIFGRTAGLAAAACAAGYSYLILYSATLLTETPFIFFLLLALNAAYAVAETGSRRGLVMLGVALAGTLLFRMAVLPFVLALLLWIYFTARRSPRPLRFWHLAIPLGIIVLAVLPWTVRNYLLFGRFMLLESQFGHVFWNSNHPDQGIHFRGSWVAPIPPELLSLSEPEITNELLKRGIQNVLADPGRFFLLTLSRIKFFFTFWPTADTGLINNLGRVFSFGIMLPFMLAGLYLSLPYWRKALPLYLFLVIHLGVYLVSWVMIRYRIPADTVLLVFGGLAIIRIAERWSEMMPKCTTRKRPPQIRWRPALQPAPEEKERVEA